MSNPKPAVDRSGAIIMLKTVTCELETISELLITLGGYVPAGDIEPRFVTFFAEAISARLTLLDKVAEDLA